MVSITTLLGVALALCLIAPPAAAQITLDGSVGPKLTLQGPNYTIDSTAGQIRGGNLFHSFGTFSVQPGQSATFTDSQVAPISNVLGRITGGESSFINGTLRSTISGANLFLFNPSGIAFGPNAALDVPAAFHASTADYLRFADGAKFHANLNSDSVLTVAPPVAFGFLSSAPAAISVDNALLAVKPGNTLSLVGGNVSVTASTVRAAGGRINVASVASPGEVIPSAPETAAALDLEGFSGLGSVRVSQGANLSVSAAAAGTVLLRSGRLVVDNAGINANSSGAGSAAPVAIDVAVTGELLVNAGGIQASTQGAATGGEVRLSAGSLKGTNGAFLGGQTFGNGKGGNVAVSVGALELVNGGVILTSTGGPAEGGEVSVRADQIALTGSSDPRFATGILANTSGTGSAGNLKVDAKGLVMNGNTSISSATFGPGSARSVTVNVDGPISIRGSLNPNIFTGIFANTFGSGHGAALSVSSRSLSMSQRGSIQAGSFSTGDASGASVKTGHLEMSGGSGILTGSIFGAGDAGRLAVSADTIVITGVRSSPNPMESLTEFTGFSSATGVNGKAGGEIQITANGITMSEKAGITTVSRGAGRAGDISVAVGDLRISSQSQIVSSAFGTGHGGNITVRAGTLIVEGAGAPLGTRDSVVSAIGSQAAFEGGDAGSITIFSNRLEVLDGAKISVDTFGAGKGGTLRIEAGSVLVSGINQALDAHLASIQGGNRDSARAAILATSAGSFLGEAATGNAGSIHISAGELRLTQGGSLSSTTNTPGAGGSIDVIADRVTVEAGSLVTAKSRFSPQAGKAGDISIQAQDSLRIAASEVSTGAERAPGGAIKLSGRTITIEDGAIVTAKAGGAGNAGDISIAASDALSISHSVVSTEATQADGGNITLAAPSMMRLADSTVSTSVGTGQGKGGNISIDPQFLLLNRSDVRADASGGPGGNISVVADVFLASDSVLSASSALSTPGTIEISARFTNIGNVARLPDNAAGAAELRTSCAARAAAGGPSSLVMAGREGSPQGPEAALPSPLLADQAVMSPAAGISGLGPVLLASACAPLSAR